jgi:hypothetical protein
MWQIKGPHVSWHTVKTKFLWFHFTTYYALCVNVYTGELQMRPVSKADLYAKL